jgi:hypothetical protein
LDNTHPPRLAVAVDYAAERARISDLLIFTSVQAVGDSRERIVGPDNEEGAGTGEKREQDLFSRHVRDRSRFCVGGVLSIFDVCNVPGNGGWN